ncbi:MAG: hypothetical protein WDO73_17855 [Ignavibacteriota bacterium]
MTVVTEGAVPVSAPAGDNVSQDGRFRLDQVTVPVAPEEANV